MSPSRSSGRGFSLLELVIVIGLVAVLATVAIDRMLRYLELAEKAGMETTVSSLRSALALKFAATYLRGKPGDINALGAQNPFDWLAEKPGNYLGEYADPTPDEVAPGSWYYDSVRRVVVYAPLRTRYLAQPAGDTRIRFAVAVRFDPSPADGGARVLSRLDVAPQQPYDWFSSRN